ncbi:MAG: hypothetical protein E6G34_10345 [Actinobacteria bacterium]|nr:MAG: hypothetical protein E6G34_10345 [Actinomycetota bacterium]
MKAASCTLSTGGWTSYAPLKASALAHKNPATVSEEVSEVPESQHPGGNIAIESTVTVEPTVAAATEWFSIVGQSELASCVGQAFRDAMLVESPGLRKPGNSVSKAHVARMNFARYGDQIAAYRLTFSIRAEGQNLSVCFDYVAAVCAHSR